MYSNVKQLRQRGKRRRDREIDADVGVFDFVRVNYVGSYRRMIVFEWGDAALCRPLISNLYEPEIVSMQGDGMLFRGFETEGSDESKGPSYVQEWIVRFIGMYPPAKR